MRLNTVKVSFKLSKADKLAGVTAKRPSTTYNYQMFESVSDLAKSEEPACVAAMNACIESYASALFLSNRKDKDYVPEDSSLNIENWHQWFTAETTRKRAVTAATINSFADSYIEVMVNLAGKAPAAAAGGAAVIRVKLASIMGKDDMLKRMQDNLEAYVSFADPELVEKHEAVIDYLVNEIAESLKLSQIATEL